MTGAYLRVQRNGKWHNVEVEFLTDEERQQLFANRDNAEMIRWLNMVCDAVCQVGNRLADLRGRLSSLIDHDPYG